MQRWLQTGSCNTSTATRRTRRRTTKARSRWPAAEVVVEEVEGNPGYYTSKFFLEPHYQLEGLSYRCRRSPRSSLGQSRRNGTADPPTLNTEERAWQ